MRPYATLEGVAPSIVTLEPKDGGLVCQVVSAALTVCRRLPAPVTLSEVVLWIIAGAVLVTLWGTAILYIEARRSPGFPHRRATDTPLPEVVPFIHFPSRAHLPEDSHHDDAA